MNSDSRVMRSHVAARTADPPARPGNDGGSGRASSAVTGDRTPSAATLSSSPLPPGSPSPRRNAPAPSGRLLRRRALATATADARRAAAAPSARTAATSCCRSGAHGRSDECRVSGRSRPAVAGPGSSPGLDAGRSRRRRPRPTRPLPHRHRLRPRATAAAPASVERPSLVGACRRTLHVADAERDEPCRSTGHGVPSRRHPRHRGHVDVHVCCHAARHRRRRPRRPSRPRRRPVRVCSASASVVPSASTVSSASSAAAGFGGLVGVVGRAASAAASASAVDSQAASAPAAARVASVEAASAPSMSLFAGAPLGAAGDQPMPAPAHRPLASADPAHARAPAVPAEQHPERPDAPRPPVRRADVGRGRRRRRGLGRLRPRPTRGRGVPTASSTPRPAPAAATSAPVPSAAAAARPPAPTVRSERPAPRRRRDDHGGLGDVDGLRTVDRVRRPPVVCPRILGVDVLGTRVLVVALRGVVLRVLLARRPRLRASATRLRPQPPATAGSPPSRLRPPARPRLRQPGLGGGAPGRRAGAVPRRHRSDVVRRRPRSTGSVGADRRRDRLRDRPHRLGERRGVSRDTCRAPVTAAAATPAPGAPGAVWASSAPRSVGPPACPAVVGDRRRRPPRQLRPAHGRRGRVRLDAAVGGDLVVQRAQPRRSAADRPRPRRPAADRRRPSSAARSVDRRPTPARRRASRSGPGRPAPATRCARCRR